MANGNSKTDELAALRALQVKEALADPLERDRVLVEAVLELRDALPLMEKRLRALERCRWLFTGGLFVLAAMWVWLLEKLAP